MSAEQEIENLRKKLEETPKNKGTEKERARLKARISELEEERDRKQRETGGGYEGYAARKRGDATVSLVGPPSVGKSTLLNAITNADSEVGSYEFTTLEVIPGVLEHRGARIQILDVPGLIGGAAEGRGRGKEVLSVVRNSDAVIMMASPGKMDAFERMERELHDAGIRLNSEPPKVKIEERSEGGLSLSFTADTSISRDAAREVLQEKGLVNASVIIREDISLEQLVDALSGNRVYMPALRVLNKIDVLSPGEAEDIREEIPDLVKISAERGEGLENLKDRIFSTLELMRVYMKEPGKEPDREEPLVTRKGSTVGDVCRKLPGDMEQRFDSARIWGESADFPEQRVGENHVLQDGDVLEIRTR